MGGAGHKAVNLGIVAFYLWPAFKCHPSPHVIDPSSCSTTIQSLVLEVYVT